MAKRCYYEVLEVDRAANDGELKSAFRKLAMQWHPDRNPNDKSCEPRFKEINEAYEVLKDPDKRAAYDRFGHAAFEQGGMNGAAHGFGAGGFADIFEDIFGDMMGGRFESGRQFANADLCVAAAGLKQPELFQLVFAGIGLKQALRLVLGDEPVDLFFRAGYLVASSSLLKMGINFVNLVTSRTL